MAHRHILYQAAAIQTKENDQFFIGFEMNRKFVDSQ